MATILNIETATSVCSVALAKEGKLIAIKESSEANVHAEKLTVFINAVMEQAKFSYAKLDAIAVGTGPGSYTGLRIGTSTAKGLCYALDKPLIAIPTLQAMAFSTAGKVKRPAIYYCSMIDARRLEVYTALYNYEGEVVIPVEAKILSKSSFTEFLSEHEIAFAGDGMPKMKELLPNNERCIWVNEVYASAENMMLLSEEYFNKKEFANVAYYEPFYLKDFVAAPSRNDK